MNILVVNDDGIDGYGIKLLATRLKRFGNVYVVSPDRPRSAASHRVMLHKPLSFECVSKIDGVKCYQTSGVPADCVRLACGAGVIDVKFDIVFSGVNNGLNLGTDIIYSGTVAGAREAVIEGIPGVAISCDVDQFKIVESELDGLLDKVFEEKLYSKDYVLNINFPIKGYSESKGIKFAHQGIKIFNASFYKTEDGKYMDSSREVIHDTNKDSDVGLADLGYITLVPLGFDSTSYEILNKISIK